MIDIGTRIAALRRQAGITQKELAAVLGTTQSALSRLESGRTSPTVEMLDRIARAIGIPLTVTFGADEPAESRSARVRAMLGDYTFNPWDRNPASAEVKSLSRDGLSRERFTGEAASG